MKAVILVALALVGCSQDQREIDRIQACSDSGGDPRYSINVLTGNYDYLWCDR